MKNIDMAWTRHIEDPEKRQDFENYLRNNTRLFDRLNEILTEWDDALARQERGKDQYAASAWSYLQAHRNGNIEILQKLKDLISFYK